MYSSEVCFGAGTGGNGGVTRQWILSTASLGAELRMKGKTEQGGRESINCRRKMSMSFVRKRIFSAVYIQQWT